MPHTFLRLCRQRVSGCPFLASPTRSDLPPPMDTSLFRACVGGGFRAAPSLPARHAATFTRRRLLQGTLGGAAGLVVWHQGWSRLQSATAQKDTPSGQMTWAIHVTLAPTWLDPSETLALATPYMLLYALHDALVKPMPDNSMAPSLAT